MKARNWKQTEINPKFKIKSNPNQAESLRSQPKPKPNQQNQTQIKPKSIRNHAEIKPKAEPEIKPKSN